MKNRGASVLTVLAAAVLIGGSVGAAVARPEGTTARTTTTTARIPESDPGSGPLQMYTGKIRSTLVQELVTQGYDVAFVQSVRSGARVDLVLTARERDALREAGLDLSLMRTNKGLTSRQLAAQQAQGGYDVFRSWDENGGIEDEIHQFTNSHHNLTQLYDLGDSIHGRDILAVRMTANAQTTPVGSRPGVLYQGTTHAREWISTEVTRRLMHWYADNAGDPDVANILSSTELWFIPVVNPDGYQFTFDTERLWRKNTRDLNNDGQITVGDGIDLNRNYPEHWNYDTEGSNSQSNSDTYRGASAGSEPETQADMSLFDMANLKFAISWHSYGQLLLYTQGWQLDTPSADDPIYVGLSGIDTDPAIPGFDPGVGADLYTTNGEFTDWAHGQEGVLAWTPEGSEGCDGCGFEFPDNEAKIQQEFVDNRGFALNVAKSAGDPDDPVTHWGMDTAPFYLDMSQVDPWKSANPSSDLAVHLSYAGGRSQAVEVLAKRDLGAVTLHYKIGTGTEQSAPTSESPDGETFGGNNAYDAYYHYMRGSIPGLAIGNSVEYWFTGGGEESTHTTFNVVAGNPNAHVLVLAAEDRTGASTFPAYKKTGANTPNYLSYYQNALAANGKAYDVYDVDARGRTAPDDLGVLSHYDAVIWYRGNDIHVRKAGWSGGNTSRLYLEEMLDARAYLNRGGKLLYTGQWAGGTENGIGGNQFYDPVADQQCVVGGQLVLARCLDISAKNDFLQYYLGAGVYNSDGGTDANGNPFPVAGVSNPYQNTNWTLNGGNSAKNQVHTASFLTTSSFLPTNTYPQFDSHAPARWDRPGGGGAFEPYDGSWYVYSQQADVSYKRLQRTMTVPQGGGQLSFRVSYDTEPNWDFVFVEAHTPGQDDWVTLPDVNGHTSNNTGESCPAGWHELHPWLERYQGADCSGAGWNAASGRSAGWEPWTVDLSNWAGGQVELSISYASDWSVQGLGTFVDAIQGPNGDGTTSFETDMGGWTVPGPQPGSAANANDFIRTQSLGFEEGAVVSTDDSLYFGFGFEGITSDGGRNAVMQKSLQYLGA